MNLFRGISLSVGSSCFLFFVCSVEAIFSSYFYIPLLSANFMFLTTKSIPNRGKILLAPQKQATLIQLKFL